MIIIAITYIFYFYINSNTLIVFIWRLPLNPLIEFLVFPEFSVRWASGCESRSSLTVNGSAGSPWVSLLSQWLGSWLVPSARPSLCPSAAEGENDSSCTFCRRNEKKKITFFSPTALVEFPGVSLAFAILVNWIFLSAAKQIYFLSSLLFLGILGSYFFVPLEPASMWVSL